MVQPALRERCRILMRIHSALLTLSFCACATSAGAQSVTAQLRSLDSAWTRSYAMHDTALAMNVMSPEIVITATNGSRKDRAKELEDVRPYPGLELHFFRSVDVSVVERGAAVIGTLEWEQTMNGRRSLTRRRYTATYARGGPLGWQMVALHIGNAPPP
jgi:hypothetical protein